MSAKVAELAGRVSEALKGIAQPEGTALVFLVFERGSVDYTVGSRPMPDSLLTVGQALLFYGRAVVEEATTCGDCERDDDGNVVKACSNCEH